MLRALVQSSSITACLISGPSHSKGDKFIAAREELHEVHVSDAWLNRTFESVLYQIALRSLYELFQADTAKAIDSIVFNGWVNSIDKATGKEVMGCVLSIQASKPEFIDINLANVGPKRVLRN